MERFSCQRRRLQGFFPTPNEGRMQSGGVQVRAPRSALWVCGNMAYCASDKDMYRVRSGRLREAVSLTRRRLHAAERARARCKHLLSRFDSEGFNA